MAATSQYPQPLRLGYFLTHTDVHVFGQPEMLYRGVESRSSPDLQQVLTARMPVHEWLQQQPDHLRFLGYDISWPIPTFHSLIAQPGLHLVRPEYVASLNQSGLFRHLGDADEFRQAAHEWDSPNVPFCVLGIWEPAMEV